MMRRAHRWVKQIEAAPEPDRCPDHGSVVLAVAAVCPLAAVNRVVACLETKNPRARTRRCKIEKN